MAMLMESRKIHRKERPASSQFEERTTGANRVAKVTARGRVFSFSIHVVIGDANGTFGFGHGKSVDVNGAKKKAIGHAKNQIYQFCLTKDGTLPHQVVGKFGATTVIMRPAKKGTGVIAGGPLRPAFDCLGVRNVVAKIHGSRNQANVIKAMINGLLQLKSAKYFNVMHGQEIRSRNSASAAPEDDAISVETQVNEE